MQSGFPMIDRELAGETLFFAGLFLVALCGLESKIKAGVRSLLDTGIFDFRDLL